MTGCLTVEVDGGKRQLFFEKGVLRFASSDDPDMRLGAILVSTGSISSIDLNLFAPLLNSRSQERVGSVLTDLGLISTPILFRALLTQMVQIVKDLFPRREGVWFFQSEQSCKGEYDDLKLEMHILMQEGIKALDDFSFYRESFASMCPRPSGHKDESGVDLTSVQRKFISKVGRLYPTKNSQMAALMGLKEDLYWRAILLFYLLGRIEFVDRSDLDLASDMEETAEIKKETVEKEFGKVTVIPDLPLPLSEQAMSDLNQPQATSSPSPSREIITVEENGSVSDLHAVDPEICYAQAEREFAQRNYFKALSLLQTSLQKGPPRAKYYQLLGRVQMQFPNLRRDAEDSFLKQAQMEPWNADPHYYLGELYQLEGLNLRAEKQFQKALDLNMEHTKAGIRMSQLNPNLFKAKVSQKKVKK